MRSNEDASDGDADTDSDTFADADRDMDAERERVGRRAGAGAGTLAGADYKRVGEKEAEEEAAAAAAAGRQTRRGVCLCLCCSGVILKYLLALISFFYPHGKVMNIVCVCVCGIIHLDAESYSSFSAVESDRSDEGASAVGKKQGKGENANEGCVFDIILYY
jgi:hypothetical protein